MPNKRAAGITVRNVPVPDDLWVAARAKAAATGVSLAEVIRRLLAEWVKS